MASGKHARLSWLTWITVFCTLVPVALYLYAKPYRGVELAARDKIVKLGRKAQQSPEIVFLAIDSASADGTLGELFDSELQASPALPLMKQGFPYPRTVYPYIIEKLIGAGAKVVALDVMFPTEKETDGPLREALDKYRDKVVFGANIESQEMGVNNEGASKLAYIPPTPSLISGAAGADSRVGYVNFFPESIWPEDDGVVRRALYRTTEEELNGLPRSDQSKRYTSLAGRILEKSGHSDLLPGLNQKLRMRYAEYFPAHSIYQIFVPGTWESPEFKSGALFKDKIVLIGPYGNWLKDELPTPFGQMLGPQIHLSALNAALTQDYLYALPWWGDLLLIVGGGIGAWLVVVLFPLPFRRFVVMVAVVAGVCGLVFWGYNSYGFLPIVLSPMVAFGASFGVYALAEQVLDRREKARYRQTFERYVSRDVVKELLDNPQSYLNTLGGARKPITVLFSDVRGFTTLTESADAQQLVLQLNEYFNEMVRIVFANFGTLDKFIGDAVMSHWGGITSAGLKEDACRAVMSAVQMRAALKDLNADWAKRGMLEIKIGIGINHGVAIVGNLGAEVKKEVTAIGDAVNVASRLEGATKEFHLDLLIGAETAEFVRDTFFLRSVGAIVVKGKTKPVAVFTVISAREGQVAPDWLEVYERGIELYQQRDFTQALECFGNVTQTIPEDWLAQEYVDRCKRFILEPPPADWAGAYVMTSK